MIEIGNIIVSAITTGLCTMWAGWSGLVGSVAGHIIYYVWLRDILFG